MNRIVGLMRREEDGLAMVIAVVLTGVLATLTLLMLTIGSHTDVASARGRHWIQSLHVAESGIDKAIARLQETSGGFTGVLSGSTDEGAFEVTVTRGARNIYTIESAGSVRLGQQLAATRELRVTMAPPSTFKNAVYSFTSLETKNNDTILGDIWANQNVVVAENTTVTGSVTAATGYVSLLNGSTVQGSARSGGFNSLTDTAIQLAPNSTLGGSATGSVTAPPDPVTCAGANPARYRVDVGPGATINGDVSTWGTKSGAGTVVGTVTSNTCSSAPPTVAMPMFTYSAANYNAATLHEFGTPTTPSATAVSSFQAWLNAQPGKQISGTFYINQQSPVSQATRLDLTGAVVSGDLTIITNTPIFSNGISDNSGDAIVFLASFYKPPTGTSCDLNQDASDCSIHLKNNFQTNGATALLAYSPFGPTSIKNNATQNGAVYGDSIQVKNNQTLTYDSRIERMVGFGDSQLEITRWVEV